MQLPKLKRVGSSPISSFNPNKKKLFLLSDDIRLWSGIATMSRELVVGTSHKYNWVQLGAAIQHPDHGKVFDVSHDVNNEAGINHASVKIYAHNGYGNSGVLHELMEVERPDGIVIFTDPRYFEFIFQIENEIRSRIPIMYYNIWDDAPSAMWNLSAYSSCDLLMNISRQTHALVGNVLTWGNVDFEDIT